MNFIESLGDGISAHSISVQVNKPILEEYLNELTPAQHEYILGANVHVIWLSFRTSVVHLVTCGQAWPVVLKEMTSMSWTNWWMQAATVTSIYPNFDVLAAEWVRHAPRLRGSIVPFHLI